MRNRLMRVVVFVGLGVLIFSNGISFSGDMSAHMNLGEPGGDVAVRMAHPQFWYDGNTEAYLLPWQADSETQYTWCRRNVDPGTGLEDDKHFYFDVDDAWVFGGSFPDLKVTVVVFDHPSNAGGQMRLQYDSLDTQYREADNPLLLTGEGVWLQHTFEIENAQLSNLQNVEADFRVLWNYDSHLHIDYVRVAINRKAPVLKDASVDLGEDVEHSLTHLHDPPADGSTIQVTQGDISCRRNETSDDHFFYFEIDDQVTYAAENTGIKLTVNYYDNSPGVIGLQYDSLDEIYKNHPVNIVLTGAGVWASQTFDIDDARFANGQNGGADFRLRRVDGEYFFIDKVRVHILQNNNSFIGGIHTGGRYFFSDPPVDYLNEGVLENISAGLRTLKLWLWFPSGYKWNSSWPADIDSRTLRGMVEHHYFRELFNRPIETYVFNILEDWDFVQGFPTARQEELEEEFYQLASFFLEEYDGTDKTFILGTWESDWLLRDRLNHPGLSNDEFLDPAYDPSPVAIEGMINWYTARQSGVNRARADFPGSSVNVYHAAEVNTVIRLCMENPHRPCVAKDVLPFVDPQIDLVSYSCWEAINGSGNEPEMEDRAADLNQALERIALLMPDTSVASPWGPPFGDNNVFIGEYGGTEQRWINGGWDGPAKLRRVVKVTLGGDYTTTGGDDQFFDGAFGFGAPFSYLWQVFDTSCCPPDIAQCSPGFSGDECCCKAGYSDQDCCGDPGDPANYACHIALKTPGDFNGAYPEDAPPVDDNSLCTGYWLRRPDGSFSGARDTFVDEYMAPFSVPASDFNVRPLGVSTFELTWQDDTLDEDQYVIERSILTDPGLFVPVAIIPPAAMPMTFDDASAEPNTDYLYRIRSEKTDYPEPPWHHRTPWYYGRGLRMTIFVDGFESGDTSAWDYAGSDE